MSDRFVARRSRGKFWLLSLLVFLAGLVIGLLIGVFGWRYIFYHRPPTAEDMAGRLVSRIDKDFSLDRDTRARVEEEAKTLFGDIHRLMSEGRRQGEEKIAACIEGIARALPEAQQRRWRTNARDYFPKGPPPPPPPSP